MVTYEINNFTEMHYFEQFRIGKREGWVGVTTEVLFINERVAH